MSEKLFKHVGEFRKHSSEHFKNIVDKLHIPYDLQKKNHGLITGPLTENETIYMDAEDDILYSDYLGKDPFDFSKIFQMKGISVYDHENIIYRVTNPNELVSIQLIGNKRSKKLISKSNKNDEEEEVND